jgi:hypothetical protein
MKGKTGLHVAFLQAGCLAAQVTFSHGTMPVNTILVLLYATGKVVFTTIAFILRTVLASYEILL